MLLVMLVLQFKVLLDLILLRRLYLILGDVLNKLICPQLLLVKHQILVMQMQLQAQLSAQILTVSHVKLVLKDMFNPFYNTQLQLHLQLLPVQMLMLV